MTKIIIIDDEVDYTEILSDYCEMNDIEVVGIGHNGQDAINLFESNSPDLVLLDLSMPKFDGFYFLDHIKEKNHQVEIIILTGLLTESDVKKLNQHNIFSTLIKPVDPDEIMKKIKNSLV